MQRFKNILAVVDVEAAEHHALQKAVELANRNNSALSVIALQDEPPSLLDELLRRHNKAWMDKALGEMRAELERITSPILKDMAPSNVDVLVGKPAIETVRAVLRYESDLLLKDRDLAPDGAPGASPTDLRLLRKCPCPVWIVSPPSDGGKGGVLAAVDVAADGDSDGLNHKLVELARSLAGLENKDFHIVHAWSEAGISHLAQRLSIDEFDEYLKAIESERSAVLGRFLGRHRIALDDPRVHLAHGDPGSVIPAVVDDRHIDTVVMGTIARAGISGFLMGNTAEEILRQIRCSVLAVKPDGFKSPVELDS